MGRATNAYAAKRAVFARLAARAALENNALSGVQVAYSWPGSVAEAVCVYGGGVFFEQPGEEDAYDGRSRVVAETATIGVHIRAALSPPPDGAGGDLAGVAASDGLAEAIGDEIAELFATEPDLAGGKSVIRVAGGQGDYSPSEDQAVSTLSLRVEVESYIIT